MRNLTEQDIRSRAYALWQAAGEPADTKMDYFWYEAEKELLRERAASGVHETRRSS
ncbi:DUF2934 domain-containing protein [Bradyrhizobium sp. ORS 86]|uniref:DUF2934 domain-containing protein n=1 Tax=unclassified Bradyrhizobium TaxID=2631580 RepID=UPI00389065FA